MTAAKRQRDYRARQAEKIERMKSALDRIDERLAGNDKPLAVELRAIVAEGLK